MKKQIAPLTEGVYYILISLYERRHGYGIMQYVSELSEGRVELGAGTLYGALKSLVEKGWIEQLEEDGRKKEYKITATGKKIVAMEIKRLKELYENGQHILEGANEREES